MRDEVLPASFGYSLRAELQEFLNTILTKDWQYFGAMVEAKKVGEIIKSLDLSKKSADVGNDFLKLLQNVI